MKKLTTCDLCGNNKFNFLFQGQDRMHNIKGIYSLNKCQKCSLIFLNPQPTSRELEKHYPKKYYSFNGKYPSKKLKWIYKTLFTNKRNFILRSLILPIKPLFRSTKIIKGGTFLDMGCGSGEFLILMNSFNMDCYGIEPGEFDKEFANKNNLKIKKTTIFNAKYPSNYFDLITLNHVLEHIENPSQTLKELYRILKSKGTIIISTPQHNNLMFKFFKKNWIQLDLPRHLYLFSTDNLKKYAKKTNLKIEKINYNSTPYQIIGSLFYLLDNLKINKSYLAEKGSRTQRAFYTALFYLLLPVSYLINFIKKGDQVEIILTKK